MWRKKELDESVSAWDRSAVPHSFGDQFLREIYGFPTQQCPPKMCWKSGGCNCDTNWIKGRQMNNEHQPANGQCKVQVTRVFFPKLRGTQDLFGMTRNAIDHPITWQMKREACAQGNGGQQGQQTSNKPSWPSSPARTPPRYLNCPMIGPPKVLTLGLKSEKSKWPDFFRKTTTGEERERRIRFT